jgi:hypothetical protein
VLSKDRTKWEVVIATRLLAFGGFVMTPSTSDLDCDPKLARILAAGLPKESTVRMEERYASAEMRGELAVDLTHMALCSPASVKDALLERFAPISGTPPAG